jgi:hypothetical protein
MCERQSILAIISSSFQVYSTADALPNTSQVLARLLGKKLEGNGLAIHRRTDTALERTKYVFAFQCSSYNLIHLLKAKS